MRLEIQALRFSESAGNRFHAKGLHGAGFAFGIVIPMADEVTQRTAVETRACRQPGLQHQRPSKTGRVRLRRCRRTPNGRRDPQGPWKSVGEERTRLLHPWERIAGRTLWA